MNTEYNLFVSDYHVPFHSKSGHKIFLDVCKYIKPTKIILGGDIIDFFGISRFLRSHRSTVTVKDEINATKKVLTDIRNANKSSQIIFIEGNHECFDESTEILTEEGWKKYNELKNTDFVLTKNLETGEGFYQKISEIIQYDYDGEMYHFIGENRIDLLTTPNHRIIYTHKFNKNHKPYISNHLKVKSGRPKRKAIKIYKEKLAKDFKLESTTRHIFDIACSNNKQDLKGIKDEEIKLTALFISEGSYTPNKYKYPVLYQRKSNLNLITDVLDKLNIIYSISERDRKIKEICNKKVKTQEIQCVIRILKGSKQIFHKLVPNKYEIPKWVFDLSKRQTDIFIDYYIKGDGSVNTYSPTSKMIYSNNKTIIDQLQHLLVTNSYSSTISEYRPKNYKINITNRVESCIDKSHKNNGNGIHKVPYKGKVWCVSIPNENIFVRRNGKPILVGNCRLFKFITIHAKELGCLDELEVENILDLNKLGIQFYKNPEPPEGFSDFVDTYYQLCSGDGKQIPPLIVGHFNKCCGSGGTAKRLIEEKGDVSIIQGHTHRVEVYAKKTITGKILIGVEAGGLFDSEQNSYIRSPNWQNGFAVIETHNSGEDYNITPIVLKNNKLVFNGRVFNG